MTEKMAYVMIGVIGYFVAYLTVGTGATAIWKNWVWKNAGEFWEYNLNYGLQLHYSGYWYFARYHNILYSLVYIVLWPIMVPWQLTINTKAMRKVMSREYWN